VENYHHLMICGMIVFKNKIGHKVKNGLRNKETQAIVSHKMKGKNHRKFNKRNFGDFYRKKIGIFYQKNINRSDQNKDKSKFK